MSITVIANPRAAHQRTHQDALIEGFKTHGIESITAANHYAIKSKFVACWGWKIGKQLRAAGHEVLVMERGYIGDRFNWSSLAWNGLNGYGDFPEIECSGERFREHFGLLPWLREGDFVLIMGQVPGDESLKGRDLQRWYEDAARIARTVYKKPVKFRPHPEAIRKGHKQKIAGCENCVLPLSDSLEFAHVVITYNSNSAVDAVIRGIPAITYDRGAMAWAVSGKTIGERVTPCRQAWANALAWKQWTIEEIASGYALNYHVRRVRYG